jgi:hypothetical protein
MKNWKTSAEQILKTGPVVPVIVVNKLEHAVPMAQALVAGGVKVRAAAHTNVTLGLPLALMGTGFPMSGAVFEHGLMQVDDREVWLVVAGAPST